MGYTSEVEQEPWFQWMVVVSDDTNTDGQTVGWQKDRSIICDRTHVTINIILKQDKQNHLVASQTFIEKAFLNLICFNSSGGVVTWVSEFT